jgi:phage protein D/phage baseplate assembly protein gpV
MAVSSPATQRVVEIDGAELSPEFERQLESAVVIDRLALPDTFSLIFRDPERDILSRAGIEIGATVTISTAALRADAPEPLFKGEVTSIEPEYDSAGSRAIVRGYDKSHRLNSGRKTTTFQNVKYSDIVSQVASDAGLRADADDSGVTHDHVLQANQSDLVFLYGLARQIGFDCRVDGDTLLFKRPTESSSGPGVGDLESEDPVQLIWNGNLLEFRARISAASQVSEVKVRGWDVMNKEAVIGRADAAATNAELETTPAALADKVGGQTLVVVDRPVGTQEGADELAAAKAEQVGSAAFEATAVAVGSSALKAGVAVSISGVDAAFEGRWVISSSRHEFGDGSYKTHLEFSGRQDRSLHGVVVNGQGGDGGARIPGVVIGIVTNNDDPEDLGRVKLQYPWLSDDAESHWARVCAPGAGPDTGLVMLPAVGDEVLVAFVHGDMSYPIVLGGLWNGRDMPPLGDGLFDAGAVKRSGYQSRTGHRLIFFDGDDETGIALLSADDKFKVSLNQTKGELHIKADGKLKIEAQSLEIKVDTDAKLEATGVEIKASGQMKLKGGTLALNPPG